MANEKRQKTKYLIHGATTGSNFGDCLFAHLFYRYIEEQLKQEAYFYEIPKYGLGRFLKKELSYHKARLKPQEADCLVYMSGGYFGDTTNGYMESIKRYFRYLWVARCFVKAKKPIYLCGVGGGPVHSKWLLKRMISLMDMAVAVTVRDEETADYFVKNGVIRPIDVTADTALCVRFLTPPQLEGCFQEQLEAEKRNGRLVIFFHVYGNDGENRELEEKIVPALNRLTSENENRYFIVVGTDNTNRRKIAELSIFQGITSRKTAYDFYATDQLCALLNTVDAAITVKLHVGVVASVYGKAVISFPKHVHKTSRFYKQIHEEKRCLLLKDVASEDVYQQLCLFIDRPVVVDMAFFEKARKNLTMLS